MKATEKQIEKAIKENADFLKMNLTDIEVIEQENSFNIRLCDSLSRLSNG